MISNQLREKNVVREGCGWNVRRIFVEDASMPRVELFIYVATSRTVGNVAIKDLWN